MKHILFYIIFLLISTQAQAETQKCSRYTGYKTYDGTKHIPATYCDGKVFQKGFAAVYDGSSWGLINEDNKTILPFKYDDVRVFEKNRFAVEKDELWAIIDENQKIIVPFDTHEFEERSAFITSLTATVNNERYLYAGIKFSTKARNSNDYNFIFNSKVIVTDYNHQFDALKKTKLTIKDLGEKHNYIVDYLLKKGLVDAQGNITAPINLSLKRLEKKYGEIPTPDYQSAKADLKRTLDSLKSQYIFKDGGVYTKSGKELVSPVNDYTKLHVKRVVAKNKKEEDFFKEHYDAKLIAGTTNNYHIFFFLVRSKGSYHDNQLYTLLGKTIVSNKDYYLISLGSYGIDIHRANKSNNNVGFVDYLGNEILSANYSFSGIFSEGVNTVREYYETKTIGSFPWSEGLINTDGKFLIPLGKYNRLETNRNRYHENFYITQSSTKETTSLNGLYSISKSRELIAPKFYDIQIAQNGEYAFCFHHRKYPNNNHVEVFNIKKEKFLPAFEANKVNTWGDNDFYMYEIN